MYSTNVEEVGRRPPLPSFVSTLDPQDEVSSDIFSHTSLSVELHSSRERRGGCHSGHS